MRNPGRKLAALALLGVATYGLGIYAATARAAPPPIHEGHGELVTITTQRQVKALIVKTWPRWARSQALRVAWRESRLMPDPPHNNAARGVYQFIPSTWNGSWNPWRHTSPTDARANIMAAHRLWQRSGGSFYPHWAATARRASSAVGVTASIGAHGPPGLDQAIRSVTKQMPPNTIMASSCVADSTAGPWDCTLDLYPTGSTVIASTYHLDVWRLATCPHGWSRCWKWHWTQVLDA